MDENLELDGAETTGGVRVLYISMSKLTPRSKTGSMSAPSKVLIFNHAILLF